MSSRSRLFVDHIFKVIVGQRSCLQGQGYLWIISSRSGSFAGQVFKVKVIICLRSGLFGGHVFKVKVTLSSCFKAPG